jgi:hypothetical protein
VRHRAKQVGTYLKIESMKGRLEEEKRALFLNLFFPPSGSGT